jgi:hypothetical protein
VPLATERSAALSGMVRPSVFVLRLMTSSNLVDCTTGRSPPFFTLQNATCIDADLPIGVAYARAIAHQAAGNRVFAQSVNRRNGVARRERDDFLALTAKEGLG